MSKRFKIFAIICFSIMIALPGLFINYDPKAYSEYENRYLEENVQLFTPDGKINSSFPSAFSLWLDDRIGFRNNAYELYTYTLADILKTSPTGSIVFGQDGWLFHTDRGNMENAKGVETINSKDLQCIGSLFSSVNSMIEQSGADYYLLLAPSKPSVYPEYISSNFTQISTAIDTVDEYLTSHTDVNVINTKQSLLQAKNKYAMPLYYRTDTHWNPLGGYVAYCKLIDRLQEDGKISTPAVDFINCDEMFSGDMLKMMHKDNTKRMELAPKLHDILNNGIEIISSGQMYEDLQKYISARDLRAAEIRKNKNAENDLRILILGDSFSGYIRPFLDFNCAEEIYVWDYIPDEELIRIVQPDIVITEITERFLHEFTLYISERMISDNILRIELLCSEKYDMIYFPLWSEASGQDDRIWYEAQKSDENENIWYADVDLNRHGSGKMIIHCYSKDTLTGEMKLIANDTFEKK